jgi:hypothetical protein
MSKFSGGCLCGAVRYESVVAPLGGGHCYCRDCRRSSGTAFCSHLVVPRAAFQVTGDLASHDRTADSGNVVTRVFCPRCGSPVYSTNAANPDAVFIRVSSLDDPEVFSPQMIVYASRAPSWARLDDGLATFPEMAPPPARPVSLD